MISDILKCVSSQLGSSHEQFVVLRLNDSIDYSLNAIPVEKNILMSSALDCSS
jgi:hypothetical protein